MTGSMRYALLAGVLASTASSIACVCSLVDGNGGLDITLDASARPAGPHRIEVVVRGTGLLGISSETLGMNFDVTPDGTVVCEPNPELGSCFVAGTDYSMGEAISFDAGAPFAFKVVKQGGDDVPPDRATIRILDGDGTTLVEQDLTTDYETREVNGSGCGRTGNASATVIVP